VERLGFKLSAHILSMPPGGLTSRRGLTSRSGHYLTEGPYLAEGTLPHGGNLTSQSGLTSQRGPYLTEGTLLHRVALPHRGALLQIVLSVVQTQVTQRLPAHLKEESAPVDVLWPK
jgi:hypothetical protein